MADKKKKRKTGQAGKAFPVEKPVSAEKAFFYMLPTRVLAKELSEVLDFLDRKKIEVWTEINYLELALSNGLFSFEDLAEEIGEADRQRIRDIGMEQAYACIYDERDGAEAGKVMEMLTSRFGGILASDTEDFQPYLRPDEL